MMKQMSYPPENPFKTSLRQKISVSGRALWLYAALQMLISMNLSGVVSAIFGFLLGLQTALSGTSFFGAQVLLERLNVFMTSLLLPIVTFLSGWGGWLYLSDRYPQLKKVPFRGKVDAGDCFWGLSIMFFCSIVFSLLFLLFNWLIFTRLGHPIEQPAFDLSSTPLSGFLLFTALVIAAPVCEELFFRGCLFRLFAGYNVLFAMVFSSLCFGMMHLNISQGVPTFFMGLTLSWYTWKTGSIKTGILLHALNNFVAFLSLYPIFSIPASLLIWILALAGAGYLIVQRNRIFDFIRSHKSGWRLRMCFSTPSMIAFGILFLLFCIGGLFL